jgi:hypothetical protein
LYAPAAQSPTLPRDGPALAFHLLPASDEAGKATIALFAAVRLPGTYHDIYGARTMGAVAVVAVDTAAGGVYCSTPEQGDMAPLSFVMRPAPEAPQAGAARVLAMESHFAFDLRHHLMLPAHSASYTVFLWVDGLTSGVTEANLPGPAAPRAAQMPRRTAGDLQFRVTPKTPAGGPGGIALAQDPDRVYGSMAQAQPGYLAILALDFRSRSMKAESILMPARGATAFDFDVEDMFGKRRAGWLDPAFPNQKLFVVASARNALSNVLVVEPK